MGVPYGVGGLVPEAKLVAAVWEDGSTFGPDDLLVRISNSRRALADSYDLAIATLQTGLEKNWTAEEYLAAAQQVKLSVSTQPATVEAAKAASEMVIMQTMPGRTIANNMQRAAQQTRPAVDAAHLAQTLLKEFTQARDALRQSLEGSTTSSNQATSK